MAKSTMSKPEIETLSYHSSLCKCPECKKNPASAPREGKEKTTPVIEPKTQAKNKESVGQRLCEKCQVPNCGCKAVILKESEQPQQCHNTMTGRECIDCVIDAKGKCHLSKPEQPKDNPGPLEKLIMDRIEHDLENIAANLEMLNPETKEQKRAKCALALEIARITGEGGIFDDLKEAFE